MSPTDLDDILREDPRRRFRLTLASGDQVIIENPLRTLIIGVALYVGISEDPQSRIGQRLRIVSIPNISLVEEVIGRHNGGRRRRR